MQVIGICRFSYLGEGGFQVEHDSLQARMDYLYDPARMEERFATFETMMLPPLRAQSDPDFTLAVVTGDSLPPPYFDRLEAALENVPQAVILSRPPGPHRKMMQEAINTLRRFDDAPCLQFRMDDDDAVAVDYVARLRAAAQDLRPLARKHRHIAIDFNRGFIARPGPDGLSIAPTHAPYTTAALALMIKPGVPVSIMNFAHRKLAQKMPTVTFSDSDMLIRGHNAHNDSRQKPGLKEPDFEPADAETKAHLRARFNIDADEVTARFAQIALPG